MRFRCLLKHRALHYAPTIASKIINSCTVLHNMCVEENLPFPPPLPEDEDDEDFDFGMYDINAEDEVNRVNPDLLAARNLRSRIVQQYFN